MTHKPSIGEPRFTFYCGTYSRGDPPASLTDPPTASETHPDVKMVDT